MWNKHHHGVSQMQEKRIVYIISPFIIIINAIDCLYLAYKGNNSEKKT